MSGYFGNAIGVWTIENGNLNRKVKLFKTPSGIKNSINYSYWSDNKFSGDIHFDKKSSTLYIPLTTEKEKLTGKYILYKFTGQYFEKIKN